MASDIAAWFVAKWQARLVKSKFDYHFIAGQMKKSGIPLWLAVRILFNKPERT